MVKKLAKSHHSAALNQLAVRISAFSRYSGGSAEDIFAKVKGLIVDMIEKLKKEAEAEAAEKGFCDAETAKTNSKLKELNSDIEKLTAKVDKAMAASAELKEDVKTLQAELADLMQTQAEMDKARTDEKAAFTEAKTDLEAGIAGVQKALELLRDYYGSSASASLMQEKNFDSFMQAQTSQPAKPSGHSASGGAGGSIISILEVCEEDFTKSLTEKQTAEATAQEEYEKVTQENKITVATKTQDEKYKTKEYKGLDKSVAEWNADMMKLNTELSAVNEYKAQIDERCIAKVPSYEEKKAKREEEIAGLKEALAVLEEEAAFVQFKPRSLRAIAA